MGDVGSASSAVRLLELSVDSLPAKTRMVVEGIDRLLVYSIPMRLRFRNIEVREGLLLHGEYGWGECAPFWDYDPRESSTWLASALEAARVAAPRPRREKVPLNVTIPVISAEDARKRVFDNPGCATAKVKVADARSDLERDCQRVEAVAEALVELHGSSAKVRVDANGAWDRESALTWIARLNRAPKLWVVWSTLNSPAWPLKTLRGCGANKMYLLQPMNRFVARKTRSRLLALRPLTLP